MCGIAGIVRFDGAPVGREDLARMSGAQRHRGPDGDGVWTEGAVGFGHRRLAIIDLSSAASQPMKGPRGDIIIYNGEVYNFRELRRELEALGHEFVSTSDTEVVLHAWTEWQEASLLRLNGHFAFAIWEPTRRRTVLVRDRFGVKPLYYHDGGSFVAFASEVKALLALPAVPRRLCLPALNEYFTFQNHLHRSNAVRRHQAPAARPRSGAVSASVGVRAPGAVLRSAAVGQSPRYRRGRGGGGSPPPVRGRGRAAARKRRARRDLSQWRARLRLNHDHRAFVHRALDHVYRRIRSLLCFRPRARV